MNSYDVFFMTLCVLIFTLWHNHRKQTILCICCLGIVKMKTVDTEEVSCMSALQGAVNKIAIVIITVYERYLCLMYSYV